jgi:hypothetical protein
MKSHHSGLTGRTDKQRRYIARQRAKGLCYHCSKPAIEGRTECKYHLERNKLAGRKYRKKMERLDK